MICAMMNVDELNKSILVVVIEKDNLERMTKADPITLESLNNRGMLPPPKYPLNFSILIAYEEDQDELYKQIRRNNINLLNWLERGRVFIKGVDGVQHSFRIPPDPEQEMSNEANTGTG
jgi:hypothetical protein